MSRSDPGFRVGMGIDRHRFEPNRPLILAGVNIPHDKGLVGHSDADAVCHAVTDAILGAAALGDIGVHFPDTDPQWKNADSTKLLTVCLQEAAESGWVPVNVDVVITTETPKINPHRQALQEALSGLLGLPPSCTNIKAKTAEGLGPAGAGECLDVQAIILMSRA